ncbi:MAG: hypothetical protein IJP17_01540, partial [Clostridia bacterium]|nr:hypothetical protein [Clostridia bacterium]
IIRRRRRRITSSKARYITATATSQRQHNITAIAASLASYARAIPLPLGKGGRCGFTLAAHHFECSEKAS